MFTGLEDKSDVLDGLHEVADKCDSLADRLSIRPGEIAVIKRNHRGDCKERLGCYVDEWLKGNGGKRSWKFLCECLRHDLVGRPDIAEKIELEKYCKLIEE